MCVYIYIYIYTYTYLYIYIYIYIHIIYICLRPHGVHGPPSRGPGHHPGLGRQGRLASAIQELHTKWLCSHLRFRGCVSCRRSSTYINIYIYIYIYLFICMYVCVSLSLSIYIYIDRERERERNPYIHGPARMPRRSST